MIKRTMMKLGGQVHC